MDFITISDAAKLTGRHEKTIRRWIKKQLDTDTQAQEKIVRDTIASGFTYRVDKDYLLTHSPPLDTPPEQTAGQDTVHPPKQSTPPPNPLLAAKEETIALLKEQVRLQQEELSSKNDQLNTMLERLREQHILLKGYQEKYLLDAPREQNEVDSSLDITGQPTGKATGQDTAHPPEQGRQANPARMDTNHKQKEPTTTQKKGKSPNRKSEKGAQKSEPPKRKGFFSFLKGK